ncbi:Dehydrodolichyl diphosphate synthase complex subunit nus1 [Pseudolycoriella hygida]|uniref:ditrans,polycis-polyprenyl diphosphate synthase [(2E,6E)-farnesyldiphosphate specific] n=1 Tax=Pseudolycoriella hygida TaxID=35572 RepID=A0A9Q0MUY9_9DIPT|nr:Dehydrodolichyl diphosphate synthase complex subunit nus1 [Pseudolycoriella hygida]
MFSGDYRYYLWKTVHILMFIVQQIVRSYEGIKSNVLRFCSKNVKSEKFLIGECKQMCVKIPKHIVLILGERRLDFASISNIIAWSALADIKCISVYDYTGIFLDKRKQFLKYLEKEKNLYYDPSSRNITQGSIVYKNGVRHSMSLNILDPRHSKFQMSELCKRLAQRGESTHELNINYIDKKISESDQYVCDPELGLYFDDVCCTFGLLPWQLRLTEFVKVNFYSTINITNFLDALYIYSKCEQRFGK